MSDRRMDLSQLLRKFVTERVGQVFEELDHDDILDEAEEEGMSLTYVKSCLKDGTFDEMVEELKHDLKVFLSNE